MTNEATSRRKTRATALIDRWRIDAATFDEKRARAGAEKARRSFEAYEKAKKANH